MMESDGKIPIDQLFSNKEKEHLNAEGIVDKKARIIEWRKKRNKKKEVDKEMDKRIQYIEMLQMKEGRIFKKQQAQRI